MEKQMITSKDEYEEKATTVPYIFSNQDLPLDGSKTMLSQISVGSREMMQTEESSTVV